MRSWCDWSVCFLLKLLALLSVCCVSCAHDDETINCQDPWTAGVMPEGVACGRPGAIRSDEDDTRLGCLHKRCSDDTLLAAFPSRNTGLKHYTVIDGSASGDVKRAAGVMSCYSERNGIRKKVPCVRADMSLLVNQVRTVETALEGAGLISLSACGRAEAIDRSAVVWYKVGLSQMADPAELPMAEYGQVRYGQTVNRIPGSEAINRKDLLALAVRPLSPEHEHAVLPAETTPSVQTTPFAAPIACDVARVRSFHPLTYVLPQELLLLRAALDPNHDTSCSGQQQQQQQQQQQPHIEDVPIATCDRPLFIVKPVYGGQGQGIHLVSSLSELDDVLPTGSEHEWVAQRYLPNPYLVNGYKFTIRLYVLVASLSPLQVYLYDEGIVKFSSSKFDMSPEAFNDAHLHLHVPNPSIQIPQTSPQAPAPSPNPPFSAQSSASSSSSHPDLSTVETPSPKRWSLSKFLDHLETVEEPSRPESFEIRTRFDNHVSIQGSRGPPPDVQQNVHSSQKRLREVLLHDMRDIIVKSIMSTYAHMQNTSTHAFASERIASTSPFQLYGFDFDLDDHMQVYLMEANVNPSLHPGSPLNFDYANKKEMMQDLMSSIGVVRHDREAMVQTLVEEMRKSDDFRPFVSVSEDHSRSDNRKEGDGDDTDDDDGDEGEMGRLEEDLARAHLTRVYSGRFGLVYPRRDTAHHYDCFFQTNERPHGVVALMAYWELNGLEV